MVNSAIGDHGNERHLPPLTHLIHSSLPLSPSPLLYDPLCLGQDCDLCQARPDKKKEKKERSKPLLHNVQRPEQ